MELGRYGVFGRATVLTTERARTLESLGYGTVWEGGSPPAELSHVEAILDATSTITVATGIVNVWKADAAEVARSYHRIEAAHPGRFLLGIGVGHPEATATYHSPYQTLVEYLDVLDAEGVPAGRMVLAALGPRVLRLAGTRTAGAHPYLVTPEHTRQARAILGPGKLLAPEQRVVLEPDPARARAAGRPSVVPYLRLTNYATNWRRLGFTEQDVAGEGSDHLVDELVVSGDDGDIKRRFEEHHAAGADHVAVQLIAEPGADLDDGYRRLAGILGLPGQRLCRYRAGRVPGQPDTGQDDIVTPISLPVIDVAPLAGALTLAAPVPAAAAVAVAGQIQQACREHGFFYVTGHGVPDALVAGLAEASAEFFALPVADKLEISMERGGRAWRGYFPVGGELTSGQPDLKEGLYFGTELPGDDPRVQAGLPLHGGNLFPRQVPRLRDLVLPYLDAMTALGQSVLAGIALSLGLDARYFADGYTADPTVLFRVFSYPPSPPGFRGWGVGEHTDYGLLTLLAQDDSGGLQVAGPHGWIDAPPVPGTFVGNIGDMLDRLTGGWYRSTPHRVRNVSGRTRLSLPFFLDPGFADEVPPLPGRAAADDSGRRRWDGQDLRAFTGTYGDYLLGKVGKVFPQLQRDVL